MRIFQSPLIFAAFRSRSSRHRLPHPVRALCVGRHPYLAEHLAAFFSRHGLDTRAAVGLSGAVESSRAFAPDIVLCDYDVITTVPLDLWERDAVLARVPLVAVSMTRRPDEVNLLDINGIEGVLYLPQLTPERVRHVLRAIRENTPPVPVPAFGLGMVPARWSARPAQRPAG